jgi:hypothetical protein
MSKVLTPLSEWWRVSGSGTFGKLIIHAENAPPDRAAVSQQFMAQNAMVVAIHPPYSLDLAPSDLHLFGHVIDLFRVESFETREDDEARAM